MVEMRELDSAELQQVEGGWYSMPWLLAYGAIFYGGYRMLPTRYQQTIRNWGTQLYYRFRNNVLPSTRRYGYLE